MVMVKYIQVYVEYKDYLPEAKNNEGLVVKSGKKS